MYIITTIKQFLFALIVFPVTITGFIDTNGICDISGFIPFTIAGQIDSGGMYYDNRTNYGFSHMAAALIPSVFPVRLPFLSNHNRAVEDFNNRNTAVVPELANYSDCNVTLRMDNTSFFDTGFYVAMSSQQYYRLNETPCAIVGPFSDSPALELSVMALASEVPQVVHRAFHPFVIDSSKRSFTSQIYPDLAASTEALVSFLLEKGRTSFIAFLYSWTSTNEAQAELMRLHFDNQDISWMISSYLSPSSVTAEIKTRRVLAALRRIKKEGYRTIVVAMDNGWSDFKSIADAAEELEMNQGDYFWVWATLYDLAPLLQEDNDNATKIVNGSAWIIPFGDTERFEKRWKMQGKEEVDRLNSVNPIMPGQPGFKFAEPGFFQNVLNEYGSSYMYDAVISVGIGACLTQQSNGTVSSKDHVSGIHNSSFSGASFNEVRFGDGTKYNLTSSRKNVRDSSTVSWMALNFIRGTLLQTTNILLPNGTWTDEHVYDNGTVVKLPPFVFRDGRTVPPNLLRSPGNQNYLSRGLGIMGLTLMSIAMLTAIISAIWVFIYRRHKVLVASQPIFLYLVCFGALLTASSILTLTIDEGLGFNEQQLSIACMSTPWLLTVGYTITYGSLFTKMWRVHKVLQITNRRQIKVIHVVWPMVALLISNLLLLILWTILDPLVWVRRENEETGDSIGECTSHHMLVFIVPIAILSITSMMTTGFFAWKTKDVDEAYTESRWVFIMILVQLEVILISIPIAILLRTTSTDGRYLGFAVLFWIISMSTLSFIMLPKYLAYRRAVKGVDGQWGPKRGERANGRVSGFQNGARSSENTQLRFRSSLEDGQDCHDDNGG